jgi:hypothetical protein
MTSYAMKVRNGLLDRVKVMPFFTNVNLPKPFTFTKNRALQVQPDSLPLCGVYFLQETGVPDGDANAGEPRFRTTVRYGFTVILENNDMAEIEDQLDDAFEAIRIGLLTDSTVYNNDVFQIQSFVFSMRRHNFGNTLDQETPFAELQWELACDLGVIDFPPIVTDNFETMRITTAFPIDGTEEEQAATPQVVNVYDLPQN